MGGDHTNRKILGLAVTLLVTAMLASPALAIGPQNTERNPNIDNAFDLGWIQLLLPSGQFTEWVPSPSLGGTVFYQHKNADDFNIGKFVELTIHMAHSTSPTDQGIIDMYTFFATEKQWIFLSKTSYWNFLFNAFAAQKGIAGAMQIANYYSSLYPNGLYIRFVIIGN